MMLHFNNRKQLYLFMSKETKRDRQRPFSAQPLANYTQKRREEEQNAKNYYEREQLIKKVYIRTKSANPQRPLSATKQSQGMTDAEKPKKVSKLKQREQMADQIMKLKLKVNGLSEDLSHQRGKTQEIRKKYNKFVKVLNVQFQNERVWNAGIINTHKVQGIRSMYDRLKEEYETMRVHYISLLKSSKVTRELEHQQYIETLQDQIKNLYQRFEQIQQNVVNLLVGVNKDEEIKGKMFLLGEHEQQCNRLEERYTKLKAKFEMKTQLLKDREKKIVFLDKYAKQQENKLRKEEKNCFNLEKQIKLLKSKFQAAVQEKQLVLFQSERQIDSLKSHLQANQIRFQEEKSLLIQQRDQKMTDLLQINRYYQSTINQLRKSNNQIAKEYENLKINSTIDRLSFKTDSKILLPQKSNLEKPKTAQIKQNEVQKIENEYQSKQSSSTVDKRVRKTADKPQNKNSLKKRRVQYHQIAQISQLMKYRLIGKNISFGKIKPIFLHGSEKDENEFITMKQMKGILLAQPFALLQDQAQLLARYLIEDVKEQFVYVDQNNENFREIVISIVKTLVGQYPLLEKDVTLQEELKRFHIQYGPNIKATLHGVSTGGKISKKKFLDVLKGVGAEFSEELIDVLLGKMTKNASSLSSLLYEEIFSENKNS